MFVKITYIDRITRRPITDAQAASGPVLPEVEGLKIEFANESAWPAAPIFYCTCAIADPDSPGILAILTPDEFIAAQQREFTLRAERKSAEIRSRRNQLLADSDWSQLADAPLNEEKKARWIEYRKALRDVTGQPDFPVQVTWPQQPGST